MEKYYAARDFYFGEVDNLEIITTAGIDVTVRADRERMSALCTSVEALEVTVGSIDSWCDMELSLFLSLLLPPHPPPLVGSPRGARGPIPRWRR